MQNLTLSKKPAVFMLAFFLTAFQIPGTVLANAVVGEAPDADFMAQAVSPENVAADNSSGSETVGADSFEAAGTLQPASSSPESAGSSGSSEPPAETPEVPENPAAVSNAIYVPPLTQEELNDYADTQLEIVEMQEALDELRESADEELTELIDELEAILKAMDQEINDEINNRGYESAEDVAPTLLA